MIIITGDIEFTPQGRDKGMAICREHSQRSRKEPGCKSHNCTVDLENPNLVRFIERWDDMDAVQTHFAVPESQSLVSALSKLKAAPFTIRIFDASQVQEMSA